MKISAFLVASLFLLIGKSFAVPILFDLRQLPADLGGLDPVPDNVNSGSMTRGGVSATLTANNGVLNQTTTNYGINAIPSGDNSAQIDGASGIAESVSITFSQDILFTGLGLSDFGSSDIASLTVGGSAPILLIAGVFSFPSSNFVSTGSSVILGWVAGNGIRFDKFIIDTDVPTTGPPASVPESGTTVTFLGLGVFGLILFRRFRC